MTKRRATLLADLILRIRKATAKIGAKKQLASKLGTSPQILNDWLSGRYSPGGEVTLQLLEWVQADEATQPKTPAGATNTSKGRKTRKLKSRYEKSKRVPKRE